MSVVYVYMYVCVCVVLMCRQGEEGRKRGRRVTKSVGVRSKGECARECARECERACECARVSVRV